jgi:Na+/phosphate symporter
MSLQSALEGEAKLLCSELLDMVSFRLEETVQPLWDVVDSMQGFMLRIESFLEQANAAALDTYVSSFFLN